MNIPALAAKLAAAIGADADARDQGGRACAVILAAASVLLAFLCSLASGTAGHNVSVVQMCFNGGEIPDNVPAEYQTYIQEMRDSFSTLDSLITTVNGMTEDGAAVDGTRVKAMFFALHFGADQPSRWAARQFVDCFVTYETRSDLIDNGDGTTTEEPYTVAIPVTDMETVWDGIAAAMSAEITEDICSNADSVYSLIAYGWADSGTALGGADIGGPVMSVEGFCSPLGAGWRDRITSDFGYRICPYHGWELHSGLDMAAPSGTPIRAALAGTVIKSYYSSSYGNYTIIDHGGGMTTAYAHQSKRLVSVGDTVEAGEIIGLVGSTGNSTGPHLHFEVKANGNFQDPKLYLP